MKSILSRRPSPALVISCIALFVSLGGVSYGVATGSIDSREIKNNQVRSSDLRNNSIKTFDIRNNEVRGFDIRNSSVQGRDVALNTLTGADISEQDLAQVPDAAALGGKAADQYLDRTQLISFSEKLAAGETRQLAANGSVSISAQCRSDVIVDDELRLLGATTRTGAVMESGNADTTPNDDHPGTVGGFLTSATPADERELAKVSEISPNVVVVNEPDGGFVVGSDGKGLTLMADSAAFGVNFAGSKCFATGVIVPVG